MISLIIKPFIIGLLAACSVGPMFVLIVYKASSQSLRAALAACLGLAIADSLFFMLGMAGGASIASHSLTIIKFMEQIGGPLLIFSGMVILLKKTPQVGHAAVQGSASILWNMTSSMFLTLSNPLTLLFFTSISVKFFPEMQSALVTWPHIVGRGLALGAGSLTATSCVSLLAATYGSKIGRSLPYFSKYFTGGGFVLTGMYLLFNFMNS